MSYQIKQGEDVVVELVVIDEDNNKVDMTLANKIRVEFSIKNLSVYKYLDQTREAPIAGYGDVTQNITNNYQLDISLIRSQSSTFPVGTLTAFVLLDFPDATLTNRRFEYSFEIGTILKGSLKDETLI